MYSFKNKIALVTGSSKGIGKAILEDLATSGCTVILHYNKSSKEAKKIEKDLKAKGVEVLLVTSDLTKEPEVKKLFSKIKTKYKKLDILVNNIGNYIKKPLDELTPKEWQSMVDSNLNATYYCMHYGLPLLRKSKSGRIINIGYAGTGQIVAKPNILPYYIAKTGALLMTKSYAVEEAKNNILINMVSPGVMENSINFPKKRIPLKKQGKLSSFSKLVLETISSDYMTGGHLEYNGGFNLL